MRWDGNRLSEHGDRITAARGCRCEACTPVAERLLAMEREWQQGATYTQLSRTYDMSTTTVKKYLRILEGGPE